MSWTDLLLRWLVVAVMICLLAFYCWRLNRVKAMRRELLEIDRLTRHGANVEAAHRAVALEDKGSRPLTFRHGIVLAAAARLAVARVNVGNLADAEADLSEILKHLGPDRQPQLPTGWGAQGILAWAVVMRGRYAEAIDIAERAVRTCAGYWGENSTTARVARSVLGQCLTEGDRPQDALPILTELLEYALGNYPANSVEVVQARHELAEAHLKLSVLDEAEAGFRLALAGYEDGVDHPAAATGARFGLAKIAALRGALDEATTGFTRVLTELMDTAGPLGPWTMLTRFELAELDARLGNLDSALASHRAVLADRIRILGPDHPDTARSRAAVTERTS